jgi:tetratricopeptide (TPR) repeat protein
MVAEVQRLRRVLEQDPNDLEALVTLARLHHEASMWDRSAEYYERAIAVEPDPELWTDLGVCYRNLGRPDEAVQAFERAHALDPTHWQSLFNLVVVAAFDLRAFDRALEALNAIEAIRPPPENLDPDRLRELREALEHARASAAGSTES